MTDWRRERKRWAGGVILRKLGACKCGEQHPMCLTLQLRHGFEPPPFDLNRWYYGKWDMGDFLIELVPEKFEVLCLNCEAKQ